MSRAIFLSLIFAFGCMTLAASAAEKKKVVLVAGKPSHPPRMHEFNAGVQLMAKCLNESSEVEATFVLNGWPKDESVFEGADAVVFFF